VRIGRSIRGLAVFFHCIAFVLLESCGHTPDAKLVGLFHDHRADFSRLLGMMQSDSRLTNTGFLFYPEEDPKQVEKAGLPRERFTQYQELVSELGLRGGVFIGNADTAWFAAESPFVFNGYSQKGYIYSPEPLAPVIDTALERYVPPSRLHGWIVYRLLEPHWYLYLRIFDS
jgi:hypothetical protein